MLFKSIHPYLEFVSDHLSGVTTKHVPIPCSMLHLLALVFAFSVFSMPATKLSYGADIRDINQFMVVDCLLPSQVRRLGNMTYAAARKAIKTSASDCEVRGGEYVAFDRASYATTLKVWLPLAEGGDPQAQTYVGEAFEKGLGVAPDYASAALWYLQAAEQGFSRAAINLGYLFEQGLGLEKDPATALFWYRRASGIDGVNSPLDGVNKKQSKAKILIIEPELNQRGVKLVSKGDASQGDVLVIGQVKSDQTISEVLINGRQARLVGDSMFRGAVSSGQQEVEIVATDIADNKTTLSFSLQSGTSEETENGSAKREPLGTPVDRKPAILGRYHALVIGNNGYASLPDLDTAVNDAKALSEVLEQQYGFSVTLMIDADRYAVLSALNDLKENFTRDDHLLVYYAGHGELDRVNRRGHWLPVDAEANNSANWISNISVTDLLNIIPSQQLLIIADSCYSGMMSRSALGVVEDGITSKQRLKLLESLSGARTRTAFTSGGVAPVLDSVGGVNSVFAAELLLALTRNRGALTGYELFQSVAPEVGRAVEKVGFVQQPEYAPLKFAGHEAGDFVFYKIADTGAIQDD